MNHIETNDPRLTAYALGELEHAERVEIEAMLAQRADLRAEVEAIRAVAGELREELMHEPAPALSASQRESIKAEAQGGGGLRLTGEAEGEGEGGHAVRTSAWWWRAGISGAAAVLLLGVLVPVMMRGRDRGGELVIDKTPAGSAGSTGMRRPNNPPAAAEGEVAVRLEEARQTQDELDVITQELKADDPTMLQFPWQAGRPDGAGELERDSVAYTIDGLTATTAEDARNLEQWDKSTREQTLRSSTNSLNLMRQAPPPAPGREAGGDERGPDFYRHRGAIPLEGDIPLLGEPFRDGPADNFAPASRDRYNPIVENEFLGVLDAPLSTFSIDVDTASYSMVRRQLRDGQRPSPDSVRLEEMINYFDYKYDAPSPGDAHPFRANVEVASCPWRPEHRLVRIGVKGMEIPRDDRPATNLVFLLDVSGSMSDQNKLPLVKEGLMRLVDHLTVDDRVAIVVYAGASGLVLDSTFVSDKEVILSALERLNAGGSTNGGAGIELAYKVAQDHFIKDGVNRVILATDGDFNVGVTSDGGLIRLIEEKAKSGVFLTTLGFGTGNLNDAMLEQLADKGNGMCAYIDTIEEAQKVLIDQMSGSLVTIAKDVKIQVEFNPAVVKSYRLLGYENRALAAQDFNDDTKDAGEIGAGHTVTALYEIEPVAMPALAAAPAAESPGRVGRDRRAFKDQPESDAAADGAKGDDAMEESVADGAEAPAPDVDPLRYQAPAVLSEIARTSGEMLTVKLRYKQPEGDTSTLVEFPVHDDGRAWEEASGDFRFAASVAAFGMILRDSTYKGSANFASVMDWARSGESTDAHGYRKGFVDMVRKAQQIIDPTAE